jgi:hypothetical protein
MLAVSVLEKIPYGKLALPFNQFIFIIGVFSSWASAVNPVMFKG